MRILMGIRWLWRGGGTETHVLTLSEQLKKLGHEITIYTSGGEWVNKARKMGMSIKLDADFTSDPSMRRRKMQTFLSRNHFDVIHAHDAYSLEKFIAATKGLNESPTFIFTVHGPYVGKAALRKAQKHADAIIAVSPGIRRALPRFMNRNKIHVVSNGINTELFYPGLKQQTENPFRRQSNFFVIGYSARFTFDKVALGKRVVMAVKSYTKNHSATEFLIAGRGSRHKVVGGPRVRVLGHVERMDQFYRSCDVIVCTGRTAAEALLCGIPVIAVGKAGYHGIVTPENISTMLKTNFGDHGPFKPWVPSMLTRDLSKIHASAQKFRQQTKWIRRKLMSTLSSKRMANITYQIYRKYTDNPRA